MYKIELEKGWSNQEVFDAAIIALECGTIEEDKPFKVNSVSFKVKTAAGRVYLLKKSTFTSNYNAIMISDDMTGKMEGIAAISTSCKMNTYCQMRINSDDPDCICTHCFARLTLNNYSGTDKNTAWNYELLTSAILPLEVLPIFNSKNDIVRFEAFGDLENALQLVNYFHIAQLNPGITFACWTKNPWIVSAAVDYCDGKPENIIIIESAPTIDKIVTPSNEWIDKTFTVLRTDGDSRINCCDGTVKRHCNECRRCYRKDTENEIYELLR